MAEESGLKQEGTARYPYV